MKQDTWTHSTTRAEYGTTGAMGSPRAWLRRAFDSPSLDATTFQPGSITPTEISVAGIWYKQPDGYSLPVTGMHRELFRWFEIPIPEKMMRPRSMVPAVPVIGLCAAVPMHEVMHWLKVYKEHGATYTWWNTPRDQSMRAAQVAVDKPKRRQLDHAQVYKMLESGKDRKQIAELLGFPKENIDYVVKKWRSGTPLLEKWAKPRIDAKAVMAEHLSGASPQELAVRHNTTVVYVYKLIKKQKELQCHDHSQP